MVARFRIVIHPWFERTFLSFIFANVLVMMMEYEGMSETYKQVLKAEPTNDF